MSVPRECGALIAGPAGVGKTRLALECLQRASALGFHVTRVTATAAQRQIPLAALAHLVPEQPGPQDRAEMLRQARAGLLRRAAGRRFVMLADDAHLLDEASAALLYQLMTAGKAFVLFTMRAGEPGPDALLTAWKDELVPRVDLTGLDHSDVAELLAALLGHVDPDAVAVLADHAQQNALVLRELVLGALRDGTLACADGMWRLTRPPSPSPRLIELIESRLSGLAPADRALAEVVAVGEPLSLPELSRLDGADLAERLERDAILSCESVGGQVRVRLAHPVYGEVLRARMPVLRTRSIAAMLAGVIEQHSAAEDASAGDSADLLRVGRLLLLSGTGDGDTLLAAARAARWAYAIPLAEQLTEAALASRKWHRDERSGSGPFEAELLAAQLSGLQGRWREADERLRRLAETARDDVQRAKVAIASMDNCLYAGLPEKQLEVADRAEVTVLDQHWRDEIRARSAPVVVMSEGPAATWARVEPLTDRGEDPVLVWAALTGAHALGRMGQTARALELAARGHAAHLGLAEPIAWYPWFHLFNQCEILVRAGRLAEAEELARAQHQDMIADHSAEGQASFASQLAMILTARGQACAAEPFALEAFVIFGDLGRPMFMQQAAQRRAAALAAAGRAAEAAEALADTATPDDPAYRYNAIDLLLTRAWVAVAAGHAAQARALLEETARLARDIGDLSGLSAALHATARIGDGKRSGPVLDQLQELAPALDGDLFPARLAHVRGLVSGDPSLLEEASAAFARIGATLLAAEAAADAATQWHAQGESRHQASAWRAAREYLARCDCAPTPALRSIPSRSALTPAERDAAELAARGYSNKAIAAELVLSVRSIENRLQHAYEKLAISSRAELADVLRFDWSPESPSTPPAPAE